MKTKLIVFMLGIVIIMVPVWALATYYTDRTAWEAAVAGYADATVPQSNLAQYQKIDLPLGDDNFFNFNVPLAYISGDYDYYETNTYSADTGFYYANGSFYHTLANGWEVENISVSAFGFEMKPAFGFEPLPLGINLYTQDGGMLTQLYDTFPYNDKFFGWVGYDVIGFSTWSGIQYYLYNFVQGVPASVPEPVTMLLLGFGLIGLAGFRRKV